MGVFYYYLLTRLFLFIVDTERLTRIRDRKNRRTSSGMYTSPCPGDMMSVPSTSTEYEKHRSGSPVRMLL